MLTAEIWPALDYSRVPYRLYHDPEAYEREQENGKGSFQPTLSVHGPIAARLSCDRGGGGALNVCLWLTRYN